MKKVLLIAVLAIGMTVTAQKHEIKKALVMGVSLKGGKDSYIEVLDEKVVIRFKGATSEYEITKREGANIYLVNNENGMEQRVSLVEGKMKTAVWTTLDPFTGQVTELIYILK